MLVIILFGLAASIKAAVLPPINEIGQAKPLNSNRTSTSRLGVIDPRFTATYRQGQIRLSATSCLMNAVNAMMELALENFTEPVDIRTYTDPGYPEVMIVPTAPAPGQRIEARYLLWGVWEGIRWMMDHQSFLDLVIGAHWDGLFICNIWITRPPGNSRTAGGGGTLDPIARSDSLSFYNATVLPTPDLSVMDVRDPLNDQHLTVSVIQTGETLILKEVFIAIFAALEYMANFPSTDEVAGFELSPSPAGETTTIEFGSSSLIYQWVILGIAQLPGYMLQQRRFTEMVFEIDVDGAAPGEGALFK